MKKTLILIISTFILGGCNRLDNHQPIGGYTLDVSDTKKVSQTFISHYNDLNIVSICLRNPEHIVVPLQFTLQDEQGTTVRSLDFNASNIDNTDCTRLQFTAIKDSEGRRYTAHIALKQIGLLYTEAQNGENYKEGQAYLDGEVTDYDLHFKTFYRQDWRSAVKEVISSFLHRLTLDPFFFILYAVLIIVISMRLRHSK